MRSWHTKYGILNLVTHQQLRNFYLLCSTIYSGQHVLKIIHLCSCTLSYGIHGLAKPQAIPTLYKIQCCYLHKNTDSIFLVVTWLLNLKDPYLQFPLKLWYDRLLSKRELTLLLCYSSNLGGSKKKSQIQDF